GFLHRPFRFLQRREVRSFDLCDEPPDSPPIRQERFGGGRPKRCSARTSVKNPSHQRGSGNLRIAVALTLPCPLANLLSWIHSTLRGVLNTSCRPNPRRMKVCLLGSLNR